jgi:hypothetical protein
VLESRTGDPQVLRLLLDSEEAALLVQGGDAGAARARERVEHESAWWAAKPDQPAHQRDRLHRWMRVPSRRGVLAAVDPHPPRRELLAAGVPLAP